MVSSTHEHHDWVRRHKFNVPVRKEEVEREWLQRGFSCGTFTDPPGKQWKDFKHPDDELIVLVSGKLEVTIGEDRVQLQPGDEAFIPAGVVHGTENTGDEVAEWLYGYG